MGLLFLGYSKEMKWAILNAEENQSRTVNCWSFTRTIILCFIRITISLHNFCMILWRYWSWHFIFCHPDRSCNQSTFFFYLCFLFIVILYSTPSACYRFSFKMEVRGTVKAFRENHILSALEKNIALYEEGESLRRLCLWILEGHMFEMLIWFYGWKFYLQNISEMCACQISFPLGTVLHIKGSFSPRDSPLQWEKWHLPLQKCKAHSIK